MVQDNHSRSGRGIVRGMHFQVGDGAAKLVRCGRGTIYDVVVDLRRGSPTFGEWEGFELSDENMRMFYCPVGFGHGFCVLSDVADVIYKQSNYYSDETERGIAYNDPGVGIEWPIPAEQLIPSERDAKAPTLADSRPSCRSSTGAEVPAVEQTPGSGLEVVIVSSTGALELLRTCLRTLREHPYTRRRC